MFQQRITERSWIFGDFYADSPEELRLLKNELRGKLHGKRGIVFATTSSEAPQLTGAGALLSNNFVLVGGRHYVNPNSGNFVHLWVKRVGKPTSLGKRAAYRKHGVGYFSLSCCGAYGSASFAPYDGEPNFLDTAAGNLLHVAAGNLLHVALVPRARKLLKGWETFLTVGGRKFCHNFALVGGKICDCKLGA